VIFVTCVNDDLDIRFCYMQKVDPLIRTKLSLPFLRLALVPRPRLEARMAEGLRGPLTLIIAPAGFGKTTLVAEFVAGLRGKVESSTHQRSTLRQAQGKLFSFQPATVVAWLSLDKNDNQTGRFLRYLVAALQETDDTIGSEAAQLLAASPQVPSEAVLTSFINDLEGAGREIALVLDDYQFIRSQAVHKAVAFLLEHCPNTFHLVIVTRSDPPLPLIRLRARGQMVELRAAELRFTEPEAAQFLNEVMGLSLDAEAVAVLEERTEGWIAGLQMAALSMRDRDDVTGFIEGFSGTHRYILDYLLEEVLAVQAPEIQHFLLYTSILERLTAPLCEAVVSTLESLNPSLLSGRAVETLARSGEILEYLERANLFLVPLDDERQWYRYHHLFADLLRTQLQKSLGDQGVARLHLRASEWYEQNGSILQAIHHASVASDDELVERLIEQHYMEMVNRGEMSSVRFWMGKLSKESIYRRPWLCLYEALSRSWFGQLDEANILLNEAEKRIRCEVSAPDAQSMLAYHAFVKSRVTAMQGDTRRAIELCLIARGNVPADNLALQNEFSITLGYEYFLYGDFINANKVLDETIGSGYIARAINNPVAAYCLLARSQVYQGRLHEADHLLQKAGQLIHEAGGQYLGATGLVEVETAALLCEWNDVEVALTRVMQGLDLLPLWGKADDLCLAYTTLARIQLALGNRTEAAGAVEKAALLVQTCGVFSEARSAVETAQVKMWLVQGDLSSVERWAAALEERFDSHDPFRFEDESSHIAQARVSLAQKKPDEAIGFLSRLEESARSGGRMGRVLEILLLEALAMRETGDLEHAIPALTECLTLAEPEGYVRVFLDEGRPMQMLLAQWLSHEQADGLSHEQVHGVAQASADPLRAYAIHLLSQFDAETHVVMAPQEKVSQTDDRSARSGQALGEPEVRRAKDMLVEPLSQRELEVLHIMALGRTNREIARQLIVAPGTVKAHTASIYRKLDVANRTEAVARARQLGILP
jgi:LuxR family maltose regulon positive regulatory protein